MTTDSPPTNATRGCLRAIATAAVVAAASIIVLICGYTAVARVGTTFPGFFVWQNGFVPAVGLPSWTGAASGIDYHSFIVAVDGRPLGTVSELESAVASRPTGSPITYSTRHGSSTHDVTVATETFGVGHFLVSTGIYFVNSIVLLLLAVTMFLVGGANAGARAVGYFALVQSVFLASSIDLFGPYRFRELYFFFAGLTPTATLFMISRFPVDRPIPRGENVALTVALLASLGFGYCSNAAFTRDHETLLMLDRAVHMAMAGGALAAFVFFAYHFLNARSDIVRSRCQVVLLASMGGFLPTMVFLVAFYIGNVSLPFNFLALPFLLFPLGIGYAVAKHDLFDVDTIVKRSMVYVTLSAGVFAAYSLAINAFDIVFESATPIASRAAEGALIVSLIVAFDPSRRYLQEIVNRLYDRRRWVYRDAVRSAVRTFTTILDMERLVPTVLSLVDETAQPTFARIYSIDQNEVVSLRGNLLHPAGSNASITVDDSGEDASGILELARNAADREFLSSRNVGDRTFLADNVSVALGLALDGTPTGVLLVGPRRSGGLYSREDIDLLRTIAGQLAVAMQNAGSFRTIATLNNDLAGRNLELRNAMGELREAQEELVIRERMAAVGEVAGAVAHTIRNPLAGMRAAAQQAHIELADHPVAELVDYFVRETDRLTSRIDSLLDFSRPFSLSTVPTSLSTIARGAADQVSGRAAQRGVRIEMSTAEGEGLSTVDPILFEQLVIELIANAVDASPENGRVLVTVGSDESAAFLEVSDEGPGIPEKQRDRMFQMFFTTKAKGTGIGLATVKRIVEAHQATIEVNNSPGSGATFRVTVARR